MIGKTTDQHILQYIEIYFHGIINKGLSPVIACISSVKRFGPERKEDTGKSP